MSNLVYRIRDENYRLELELGAIGRQVLAMHDDAAHQERQHQQHHQHQQPLQQPQHHKLSKHQITSPTACYAKPPAVQEKAKAPATAGPDERSVPGVQPVADAVVVSAGAAQEMATAAAGVADDGGGGEGGGGGAPACDDKVKVTIASAA